MSTHSTMHHSAYSNEHRRNLFEALHANAREGSDDWDRVFRLMRRGQQAAERADLQQLTDQFASGRQLVIEELRKGGQFLDWELQFMQLGMAVGDLSGMYERIALHYQLLHSILRDMRRHMWLPLALLMLLIWGLPLLEYRAESIGLYTAVGNGLLATIPVLLMLIAVPLLVTAYRVGWLRPASYRWCYRLPGLGRLLANYQTYHFLRHLATCIQAGFDLGQSLKQSARRMPESPQQGKFIALAHAIERGEKLSVALQASGLLDGVPVPAPARGMTAQQAQLQLTEAVYLDCLKQAAFWSRFLPWLLLALAPLVVVINALSL